MTCPILETYHLARNFFFNYPRYLSCRHRKRAAFVVLGNALIIPPPPSDNGPVYVDSLGSWLYVFAKLFDVNSVMASQSIASFLLNSDNTVLSCTKPQKIGVSPFPRVSPLKLWQRTSLSILCFLIMYMCMWEVEVETPVVSTALSWSLSLPLGIGHRLLIQWLLRWRCAVISATFLTRQSKMASLHALSVKSSGKAPSPNLYAKRHTPLPVCKPRLRCGFVILENKRPTAIGRVTASPSRSFKVCPRELNFQRRCDIRKNRMSQGVDALT